MPKRKRAAEAKRKARPPREIPGWTVEPIGKVVQMEDTWAAYEAQHAPEEEN